MFKGLAVLSLQDSLRSSTHKGIKWCHIQNSAQWTKMFLMHLWEHVSNGSQAKEFLQPFLKNKVPMLLKWPPTFFLQEAHSFDSRTSTRPTYHVSCKGYSWRYQQQGVQKVFPKRTSSGTLRAREGSCPRNGFPSQEWSESQDYHWGRCRTTSAISLLLNLEAAQQGRSMLFLDEQKLLMKEGKRGLHKTPNWILWAVN